MLTCISAQLERSAGIKNCEVFIALSGRDKSCYFTIVVFGGLNTLETIYV